MTQVLHYFFRASAAQQEAEIAPLRALVAGYERGRFIRLMR